MCINLKFVTIHLRVRDSVNNEAKWKEHSCRKEKIHRY